MSAAEEETLAESGENLLVHDLPKGLIHDLASSPDHPAAKKPCMDSGACPSNFNSPSTSSDSALAQPARSPVLPAAAAAAAPASSLTATAAAPNASALRAAAYAAVASGANPPPALPASLFASPTPGGSPRNLRCTRTAVATPVLLPRRRRMIVTLLLPEAGLESHHTEILAGINAQLCGFMFDSGVIPPFEHTSANPSAWPAAFYVDRFKAFTAAKAAGAPTLSIRNAPLEFDPEDIRASLLGTTEEDGAHWLADLADFHRASDPYEDTFFTHLAGLPVATRDDLNFERISSEILLERNKPAMLLNFSCHVCSLCGNNHCASDHEAFAVRCRGRLTNKNTISIAQLQQANAAWVPANPTFNLPLPTPLAPLTPLSAPAAPLALPSPPSPTSPVQHSLPRPPMSWGSHSLSRLPHPTPPSLLSPTPAGKPTPQDAQPLPPSYPPLPPDGPPSFHEIAPHPHPPPALPPSRRLHLPTDPPSLPPPDITPTSGAFPPMVSPEDRPPAHPYAGMETLPSPVSHPPVSNSTIPCSPHTNPTATVPSALTGPPDPHRGSPPLPTAPSSRSLPRCSQAGRSTPLWTLLPPRLGPRTPPPLPRAFPPSLHPPPPAAI
ncbi:unnamed protein product [Closterium sp. NIES-64]|nr:unnamed protein product [Closterium sp. NIES-64]